MSDTMRRLVFDDIVPGARIRHFKGKIYIIVGVAKHTENGETLILYSDEDDPNMLWARPINMFFNIINGQTRFVLDG